MGAPYCPKVAKIVNNPVLLQAVLRVAVLGLGEAGSRLAADLVSAGADVRGYDPAPDRGGLPDLETAVAGADVVLSVNAAGAAVDAARSALPVLREDAVYADLNTGSPALKQALEAVVGARFADVALLRPVPERGLATPALASGPAADAFAEELRPLGMPVEVVSTRSGDAASMKLVRSVFMKGLAAAVIESHEAAREEACEAWLEDEIAAVIGRPLLERLLEGSRRHAARRLDEMEAAAELLEELGVEPRIARASAAVLADLAAAERTEGGR
jgi:3-hydroxyisobutyrate dehydrogenase-like beta-hydroxyacid dehydrogenase